MKNEHIIEIIESMPLSAITETDLAIVRAHVGVCASCEQAFAAARVSSLLLQQHASATFAAPPFFQTRVLARLREQQATSEQWSWGRLWRATGALASSMVATVAAIAVLTFVVPGMQSDSDLLSAGNTDSAEEMILDQNDLQTDDQVSDAQVLNTLYATEEEK